jgi:hypothetical protein
LEIHTLCPFRVGTLFWEAQPGQLSLSVIVNATFTLVHNGEAFPASEQLAPADDEYWDNNVQASIHRPGESVPVKRRVDVILAGHAYAPGGEPTQSLVARLRVGEFEKAIRVTGDRLWTKPPSEAGVMPGHLVPGPPSSFVRMPLRYERAARSGDNPVGLDLGAPPSVGRPALPNIESIDPANASGFGVLSPTWPPRRKLLDAAALAWAAFVSNPTSLGPVPVAFNFDFFNVAPREQQLELLRAGTAIKLEGLSPTRACFETRLPAIRPQVFRIHPGSQRVEEIVLRCDTLWIDSDRGIAVQSFRGLADLGGMDKSVVGKLLVCADPQGKRLRFERVEKMFLEHLSKSLGLTSSGGALTGSAALDDEGIDPLAIRHDAVKSAASRRSPAQRAGGVSIEVMTSGPPPEPNLPPSALPAPPSDSIQRVASRSAPGSRSSTRIATLPSVGELEERGNASARSGAQVSAPPVLSAVNAAVEVAVPAWPPSHERREAEGQPHDITPAPPSALLPAEWQVPAATMRSEEIEYNRTHPSTESTQSSHEAKDDDDPDSDSITAERRRKARQHPPLTPPPVASRQDPYSGGSDSRSLGEAGGSTSSPSALLAGNAPHDLPHPITSPSASCAVARAASEQDEPPGQPSSLTGEGTNDRQTSPCPTASGEFAPPSQKTEEPQFEQDPSQISIESYAAISAELAQKGVARVAVLQSHQLTVTGWAAVDRHWTRAIAEQTERGERVLLTAFDAAYIASQERFRRPIGVAEYARILVGLERGNISRVLVELELQLGDLMRLQRVWTKRIDDIPELADQLRRAMEDARCD